MGQRSRRVSAAARAVSSRANRPNTALPLPLSRAAVGAEGALDVPYSAVRWDGAFEAVIERGGHSADILRRQRGGHGVGAGRLRRQVVQTAVHGGGGEALRRFDDDEPAIP